MLRCSSCILLHTMHGCALRTGRAICTGSGLPVAAEDYRARLVPVRPACFCCNAPPCASRRCGRRAGLPGGCDCATGLGVMIDECVQCMIYAPTTTRRLQNALVYSTVSSRYSSSPTSSRYSSRERKRRWSFAWRSAVSSSTWFHFLRPSLTCLLISATSTSSRAGTTP